jgi:hypothetical protein
MRYAAILTIAVLAPAMLCATPPAFPVRYQFHRPGPAYLGDAVSMKEYPDDEPIYRTVVACGITDGEYIDGGGVGGAAVLPQCRNSRYMFGFSTDGHVYRSTDGLAWELTSTVPTSRLIALADDTLIRTHLSGYTRVYRSTDDGVTWQTAMWADTREEFAWITAGAWLRHWGWYQAASGALVMVEYKLPTGGRFIYRSDDSGATWRMVHDAGISVIKHFHAVCKHEGLGRWVAATGDNMAQQKLIVSDDDGMHWYDYTDAGDIYEQPTALLDYGHPTRLLFGSDRCWQVGWLDVSDGPEARRLVPLITNWDPRPDKNYCFSIFRHDGVYYACQYDGDSFPNNVVISVSTDLEHWGIYHRFVENENGVLTYAGEAGGKLHMTVAQTSGPQERHFAISPARLAAHNGLVVAPEVANCYPSPEASSAESLAGWLNTSEEVPPGSGQKGLFELVTTGVHHGSACAHYRRDDGGYMSLLTPPVVCEVGKTYQARVWLRGSPSSAWARWKRNMTSVGETVVFGLPAEQWREVIFPPYTVPADTTDLRLALAMTSTTDHRCEVYADSLQIEAVPSTHWQLGGTPRAATDVQAAVVGSPAWTNVFSIEPDDLSDFLAAAGERYIRTWWLAPDSFLELYFDPADMRFKLRPTLAGMAYEPLASTPQHFQQRAHVRLAVRVRSDYLALSVANGRPIETVGSPCLGIPAPAQLALACGSCTGADLLPFTLFNDCMISTYVEETDLAVHMDDVAGSSLAIIGDVNCDGQVNAFDIDPFVLALTDTAGYAAAYPDCDISTADINGDGEVDAFDIDPFVDCIILQQ